MSNRSNKFHQVPTKTSINSIKEMQTHKLIVLYRRLLIKFKINCNHLWLNTECLKRKVFPNYINRNMKVKFKSSFCKKALFIGKLTWLKSEIKKHYHTRDNISMHLKVAHSELTFRLHAAEFDTVWREGHDKADMLARIQFERQNNKLAKWTQNHQNNSVLPDMDSCTFHPRVINQTSVGFTLDEQNLLNKGLGYAPQLNVKNKEIVDVAIHIDAALPDDDLEGKVECVRQIKENCSQRFSKSNEEVILQDLNKKINENNLIVTKADKSNSICIIEKDVYINKMNDMLSKMNLEEIEEDPTKKYNKITTCAINKSKLIFNDIERYQLKQSNPSAPIVYGLLKLHKDGTPVRPVSSAFNAPTQKLGKKLNKVLSELLEFKSKHSIKNTSDLVNKISNFDLPPNAKLVSFDVCNLFPSIPVSKLKTFLYNRIREKILNKDKASQLIEVVDIYLNQNYFYFNDRFYVQREGLAMGASLSPFLADFYMDVIEQKIFNDGCDLVDKILCWYRYVDDVFCIWTGSERQVNVLLNNYLNKIDDNIKFTLEYGGDKLNFLDITVNIKNKKFEFDIYRKPTSTDAIIPYSSNHPNNIKMSAFHSMLDRLLKVPLSEFNFKKELNVIIKIAIGNGYSKRLIYSLLRRKNKKSAVKLIYPVDNSKDNKIWKKIPYVRGISDRLRKTLLKHSVQPAYFNNKTLGKLITNNKLKPKVENIEKSGVYSIGCNDCNAIYVGKTKRSLKIRFSEHFSAARNNRATSGLAKHLIDSGHTTSSDHVKLIKNINGGKILDRYEVLEIKREKEKGSFLVNDQIDFRNFSPLIQTRFITRPKLS